MGVGRRQGCGLKASGFRIPPLQEDSRPQPGAVRRVSVGGRQERGLGTPGQQDHRAVVRPDQESEGCLREPYVLEVRGRLDTVFRKLSSEP